MQHYAEQSGLRLSVSSEKGKGTAVRAIYENGTAAEGRAGVTGPSS
jgi:hypothetical protein